jgi:hydrogenase/urease accessory protein HupE
MSNQHGSTPAAWTAVSLAMVGFAVGGIALMLSPVSWPLFWVGIVLAVVALPVFGVLSRMGFNS